jgi:hypothetical protein
LVQSVVQVATVEYVDALEAKAYRVLEPAAGIVMVSAQEADAVKSVGADPEVPEVGDTLHPLMV